MKIYALTAILALASLGANANELLITPSNAKAAIQTYSLDFVTDGNAVALQYNIQLPKGISPEMVDLSACTSDLPGKYEGKCSVAKGQIIGFVVNDANEPFPAGVLPIGTLKIMSKARAGKLSIKKLEVVDRDARIIDSSVRFGAETSAR